MIVHVKKFWHKFMGYLGVQTIQLGHLPLHLEILTRVPNELMHSLKLKGMESIQDS